MAGGCNSDRETCSPGSWDAARLRQVAPFTLPCRPEPRIGSHYPHAKRPSFGLIPTRAIAEFPESYLRSGISRHVGAAGTGVALHRRQRVTVDRAVESRRHSGARRRRRRRPDVPLRNSVSKEKTLSAPRLWSESQVRCSSADPAANNRDSISFPADRSGPESTRRRA